MAGSIASHVARRVGPFIRVRPARIACVGGVVSFTFDDFPKSALHAGGAILEKSGLRGTYYAALGLAGSDGNQGPIAELAEMRAAAERGHELACHTYSHLDMSRAAAAEIRADVARNAGAFAALVDGFAPRNFAYPYGRYLLPARRLVAPLYESCRGTSGGINRGLADLANLRGTRIYSGRFDAAALKGLIDRNRAEGGWLIFYTHDVGDRPSPYGCTPAQLEMLVAYAAERSPVLTVQDALSRVGAAPAPGANGGEEARGG